MAGRKIQDKQRECQRSIFGAALLKKIMPFNFSLTSKKKRRLYKDIIPRLSSEFSLSLEAEIQHMEVD